MLVVNAEDESDFELVKAAWNQAKKVIVLTGAGISTACGISDFRSKDGLSSKSVRDQLLNLNDKICDRTDVEGTVVFEKMEETDLLAGIPPEVLKLPSTELLQMNVLTTPGNKAAAFFRFIALYRESITQTVPCASKMHFLVNKLKRQKRLAHWYTQNIDGLEAKSGCKILTGLPEYKEEGSNLGLDPTAFDVLQLHGGLQTAWCLKHAHVTEIHHDIMQAWRDGESIDCPHCHERSNGRRVIPLLRPGIVLYDETHPCKDLIMEFVEKVVKYDLKRGADLLLIAGTSLRIHGAINFVKDIGGRLKKKGTKKTKGRACVIIVGLTMPPAALHQHIDIFVKMNCEKFADIFDREAPPTSSSKGLGSEVSMQDDTEDRSEWLLLC